MKKITIATRGSKLALWQAEHIAGLLTERYAGLSVDFNIIKTTGDKIVDVPLAKVGGKGLFVKEIEQALLDGHADIAVHSMKDVPAELPEGLTLGIIPERAAAHDLLLTNTPTTLKELHKGATVGTSSLRRQTQLLSLRPDLDIQFLRGNLDTRIRKLQEGQYDAIVLAAAGLDRLQIDAPHRQPLEPPHFYPAVGQGALGIEYARDHSELEEMLGFLDHAPTRFCVQAERAFLHTLEGGCQVPIAGFAQLTGPNRIHLSGLVADLEGRRIILKHSEGKPKDAVKMGRDLARKILDLGGKEILDEVYGQFE